MSINLITGKPGAGKSYLAVTLLIEKYYKKRDELWVPKDDSILVCSNIDGLQLPHLNIPEYLTKNKLTYNKFFDVEFQKTFTAEQGKKLVYVLDECQVQFGPYFKKESVIFYFDYHRHLDHEIWLISQDKAKICKQISVLSEFEYRAVAKSLSIAGEMKYNVLQSGEQIAKRVIKPKKEVYELYKSAIGHNQHIKKNRIFIYLIFGAIFIACFMAFFIFYLIPNSFGNDQKSIGNPIKENPAIKQNLTPISSFKPPIAIEPYVWVKVDHLIVVKKKILYIFDYLTRQFIVSHDYPFAYKLRGKQVFAYLPAKLINAKAHDAPATVAGPQAGAGESVGGRSPGILSGAARAYQGIF